MGTEQHKEAGNARPLPGSSGWMTGEEVVEMLGNTKSPTAAIADLDAAVMDGRVIAQPTSVSYPRPKGALPDVEAGAPLTKKEWWRIMQMGGGVEIWSAPVIRVPVGANDKAVDLIGLRFDASDIRALAAQHGLVSATPPPGRDKGGRLSGKHGKPIARITMRLLKMSDRDLQRCTGEGLSIELNKEYNDAGYGMPSPDNSASICVGIIKAVRESREADARKVPARPVQKPQKT